MNELDFACRIIHEYNNNRNTNLKLLLSNNLKKNRIKKRDKITNIVYGVIRHQKLIDHILDEYIKNRKGCSKRSRVLLQIGLYLLYFSKSLPEYAIVNELVTLGIKREKGFLNAILRTLSADKAKIKSKIDDPGTDYIKYSGSIYYINAIEKLGSNKKKYLQYLDKEPVFHIRPGNSNLSKDDANEKLKSLDIDYNKIDFPDTYEVKKAGEVIEKLVSKGTFYFQNTGSQFVSLIAAKYSSKKVLDCCSAPGTKSFTLSFYKPDLQIIGNDIRQRRLSVMKRFGEKIGTKNIDHVVSDLTIHPFRGNFDLVLIDAPCSSSGTARKNPDLKMKLTSDLVKKSAELQTNIYTYAMALCKRGGYILYSVCSFIDEEGDKVVGNILTKMENRMNFEIINLDPEITALGFKFLKKKYGTLLLPDKILNNDLFYISLVKRN